MSIATLGPVVFEVNSSVVRTWKTLRRTGKAAFARHEVVDGKPRLQFTGEDIDEVSLTMTLNAALGVNPLNEIKILREIKAEGKEQRLVIGGENFGKFVLETFEDEWRKTDGRGRLLVADVQLHLLEYVTDTSTGT